MATIGIELCNVGFQAAVCTKTGPQLLTAGDRVGAFDWPGYAHHDGKKYSFGRAAEDAWFVEPRQVCYVFGDKLSHESSPLTVAGKPASFSELAYYFLREFTKQVVEVAGPLEQVVLAVPSAFLKDAATEEQKIGLLLGMAGELKLPLAGVVDMADSSILGATLCIAIHSRKSKNHLRHSLGGHTPSGTRGQKLKKKSHLCLCLCPTLCIRTPLEISTRNLRERVGNFRCQVIGGRGF